jgi:hypothetical protein
VGIRAQDPFDLVGKDGRVTTGNRNVIAGVLLAAATVGCWAAWLAWESGYTTDVATGATSGPYSWWQVAGCAFTLAVLAAVAARRLSPLLIVPIMAVAFTAAWSVEASASDETGLWGVGAVLVLFGTAAGTGVVAALSRLLRRSSARPGRSLT